jgi:hypothetical protein
MKERSFTMLTPIERHGGVLVKRDDLADESGVLGGKARTVGVICRDILKDARLRGATIYAARNSVTPAVFAKVCQAYGVRGTVHTAKAKAPLSTAYQIAMRCGIAIIEHSPGYMTVLRSRAREQALRDRCLLVGFGLDYPPALIALSEQCANLPNDFGRLVVPVGSGNSLKGILRGLENFKRRVNVLGVCVGSIPDIPTNGLLVKSFLELRKSSMGFSTPARDTMLGDLSLNPYYEAKCLEHLEPGDLLWLIAR